MTISIKSAEVEKILTKILTVKRQAHYCVVKIIHYLVRYFNRASPLNNLNSRFFIDI